MKELQKSKMGAGRNLNGFVTILVILVVILHSGCTSVDKMQKCSFEQSMEIVPATTDVTDLEKLKTEVKKWEEWDNHEVIYALLEKNIKESFSPELWSYVLDYTQMHLMRLKRNYYCHEHSVFSRKTNYGKKKSKNMARAEHFNMLTKDTARNWAMEFEMQKQCIQLCHRQFLCTYRPVESDETRNEYRQLWNRNEALKRDIINARCNFISRGVISPYLAETEKCLFLAKGEWYRLYKSHTDELYKAVDFIATPAHKEWLYESDDETREQFIRAWSEMKKLSSRREWEEFQVIVTLRESFDPSKKVGAEAWWDK